MKKLAIQGHKHSDKKPDITAVDILSWFGAENRGYDGSEHDYFYIEDKNPQGCSTIFGLSVIHKSNCDIPKPDTESYISYSVEDFLTWYPYKPGDVIKSNKTLITIKGLIWKDDNVYYKYSCNSYCKPEECISPAIVIRGEKVNSTDPLEDYSLDELKELQAKVLEKINKKEERLDFPYKTGDCFYRKNQKGFCIFEIEHVGEESVDYSMISADACNCIKKTRFTTTLKDFYKDASNVKQINPIASKLYSEYIESTRRAASHFIIQIYKLAKNDNN